MVTTKTVPSLLLHPKKCKSHLRLEHDLFTNYRVKTELDVIEMLYKILAVQKRKDGNPLFVFWDKQCLNDGQNWEMGFMNGLQKSQAIVLLMSNSVCRSMTVKSITLFIC